MTLQARLATLPGLLLLALAQAYSQTPAKTSFSDVISPILSQNCAQCHAQSPMMGNLDLRTRETALKGGQHGPAIVPGNAAGSRLYQQISGQQKPQMPMGGKLTDAQVAAIKNWIDSGAAWEGTVSASVPTHKFTEAQRNFWAFQKVAKLEPPRVQQPAWVRTPIDAFVLAKLESNHLKPNAPADKVTLIRRAYADLIGLPPSPDEVQAFVADDSPAAFERVVDRLLASPQYGERWARHWLDLAHYADTAGFKADETRPNVWRYRDYVIRAFNDDKPYDRFVKEQIAGDELYPDDADARIATGFNRLWPDESNLANPILRRQEILNDITDTVGAVFMGMTYGCARCHDHKFDPILQKDYYRLQAFFANIRNDDHASLLTGKEAEAYRRQRAEWETQTQAIRAKMEEILAPIRPGKTLGSIGMFPKEAQDAIFLPAEQRTPAQWQMYYRSASRLPTDAQLEAGLKGEAKQRYADLKKELAKFDNLKPAEPPVGEAMIDASAQAPATYLLTKGIFDSPEDEVQPGFLSILDASPAKIPAATGNTTGRRTALANWLADPKNPLTARVMVNRIWQDHFGNGIAGTASDFGVMGERPTNPQLLDYLTSSFVENGWSIKKMQRMIMLSSTYQESSAHAAESAKVDPDNKLMWRFDRRRLEGEVIRDSMLYVSGLLNPKMGGPGVFPPLPDGFTRPGSRYSAWKTEKEQSEADRRSVYVFVKRNLRYPMFEAFDFPDTHESCSRRFATVSPVQPLALMNDVLVRDWSAALAGRVLNDSGLEPEQQVERAFRIVLNRAPKAEERQAMMEFLTQQSAEISGRLAKNEAVALPSSVPTGMQPARAAAFVDLCQALMNSNEFLYIN